MEIISDLILITLAINLLMIFTLFFYNINKIISFFKSVKRRTWFFLVFIFLFALVLRCFFLPHFFRHGYEGDYWYTHLAKSVFLNGETDVSISKSPTWSLVITPFYFFFGLKDSAALYLSSIIGSLSIFSIFLFIYSATRNEKAGLFGSFLLSVLPLHLDWSRGGSYSIFTTFLLLTSFTLLYIYANTRNKSIFLLSFFILVYIVQISPQYFLTMIIYLFILIANLGFSHLFKLVFRVIFLVAISFILIIPSSYLFFIYDAPLVTNDKPVKSEYMSTLYVRENILILFKAIDFQTRPMLFKILVLLGFSFIISKRLLLTRFMLPLLIWILVFFLIHALNVLTPTVIAGGKDYRIISEIVIALVVIAAFSANILSLFFNKLSLNSKYVLLIIWAIFVIYLVYLYSPLIIEVITDTHCANYLRDCPGVPLDGYTHGLN